MTKEQSIINKLLETFSREEISLQHFVLGYKIDAYFVKYKLAVEIDEHNHEQRNNEKELMRENAIKQKLGCILELILMMASLVLMLKLDIFLSILKKKKIKKLGN